MAMPDRAPPTPAHTTCATLSRYACFRASSSSMPISWYCVTSCSKSEDSPMMAVSDRMLAISVSISSLASVPACWAVARSRSFTLLMVLASSSFSMLNRSNTASAAPAARPPQNAWELLPPRSSTFTACWLAALAPIRYVAHGPSSATWEALSPMDMPVL